MSAGPQDIPDTQKNPKICTHCRDSKAKFYLCHSIEIARARPP